MRVDFAVLDSLVQREFEPQQTMDVLANEHKVVLWWGARNFSQYKNKALFFRVWGRLHKGIVCITLAWDDTYTITLLNSKFEEKQTRTDVYFDELVNNIDHMVETR
jgi:hypothetical protein